MRRKTPPKPLGFVYLLHFERPISERHTCQHYLGYTDCLPARIQAHGLGHGASLTKVAKERGIGFEVVMVWQGDRALERRLKKNYHGARLCPYCAKCSHPSLTAVPTLTPQQIRDELLPF